MPLRRPYLPSDAFWVETVLWLALMAFLVTAPAQCGQSPTWFCVRVQEGGRDQAGLEKLLVKRLRGDHGLRAARCDELPDPLHPPPEMGVLLLDIQLRGPSRQIVQGDFVYSYRPWGSPDAWILHFRMPLGRAVLRQLYEANKKQWAEYGLDQSLLALFDSSENMQWERTRPPPR